MAKFFTCYLNYAATGEGNTLMFALCNTASCAEKTFRDKFGDYYAQGCTTVEGLAIVDEDSKIIDMSKMLPVYILEMYEKGIPVLQYWQCHHYNLS